MKNLDTLQVIDITPEISESLAVFPGDQQFKRNIAFSMQDGAAFSLSSLLMSAHTGAHTDAPNHYHKDGQSIEQRPLTYYLGPCQVIEVNLKASERIRPEHIDLDKITEQKILFKTSSFKNPNQWNDDFNSLSPELVSALNKKGVTTIGIDTPSVDPASEKVLSSHHKIYECDMAILEGIILEHVEAGHYFLIALPLKIKDADATPVRAILLKEK